MTSTPDSISTLTTASLPSRPSLENLRNQAKSLLKSYQSQSPESERRFQAVHPDFQSLKPASTRLADAQLVIARELGFPSWPRLKSYIESLQNAKFSRMRPFQTDIEYFEGRAQGLVSQFESRLPLAAQQVRAHDAERADLSDDELFALPFSLDDAKLITAREHGFTSWAGLKRHLHDLAIGNTIEPFLTAFRAIEQKDLSLLDRTLRSDGTLIHASGTNGNTLLNLAGSCRFTEGARLLIAAGADVNKANVRGWSPLHQAAYSDQPELIQILIDAGAKPDLSAHGDGGTPLIVALFWGHREAADILAAHSLAPGNLRAAAGTGNMALLRSLFGADKRLLPAAGAHRDFYRPHSGFPVWAPSDSSQEILDEALVYAAKSGRQEAMAFLLEHGADINADPYRGTPLLWVAAGRGDIETAKWLIEHGADVNRKATFGGPTHGQGVVPLHLAAQNGTMSMVKLLIENGADPSITDDLYGGNAVGHAGHFGHSEVADYLRTYIK